MFCLDPQTVASLVSFKKIEISDLGHAQEVSDLGTARGTQAAVAKMVFKAERPSNWLSGRNRSISS